MTTSSLVKRLASGLLVLIIGGCSSNKEPQNYTSATPVIHQPAPLIMFNDKKAAKNYKFFYGNDKALEAAFRQYVNTGKTPNIKTDGFIRFAYNGLQQPIIDCMPFQQTVITLEPGEKFTSITSGDPQNLSYMVVVSGAASGVETQQVLVKPSVAKLATNMIIATDRRLYNLQIVVGIGKGRVSRNVSFWYPDEMVAQTNQSIEKQNDVYLNAEKVPQLNLAKANFNYKISGDEPSWTPVRAFDDGKRTWIEFPQGTDNKTLPTILIQSDSKQLLKYNQSYYSPYMIVDGIFSQAKLVAGVGSDQVQVDVYNKNYKQ